MPLKRSEFHARPFHLPVPLVRALCLALLLPPLALAQEAPPPIDLEAAAAVYADLEAASDADGGALWGLPLYGPLLLVDPPTRFVVANEAAEGLERKGDLYVGTLPETVPIANTALTWDDCYWAMVMWPLPEADASRRALGMHELWHRVQADLGFPSTSPSTLHLGTRDGRVWLRLEWRALTTALRTTGEARRAALRDALRFRDERIALSPDAEADERSLLMHEGLAEYTGVRLSGLTEAAQQERAASALEQAHGSDTYVRSFAYASGPAYGLLLDDLAPDWRTRAVGSDLPALAADALRLGADDRDAVAVAGAYDGEALMAEEDSLAEAREARLADLRRRFAEGPVLRLDFRQMNVTFDPHGVEALDDLGTVYTAMEITDSWGTLAVTDGGLIAADWSHALVPAPHADDEGVWTGEGYTLTLAEGWDVVPGLRAGDLTVEPDAE